MKFKGSVIQKNKRYTNISKNFERIHLQAAAMIALDVMNESKLLIQKTSAGEKAVRYLPKRTVTVSKPGDPPNSDTGRLINSIRFWKDGNVYKVGTNVDYGAFLEFGTKDTAPRPWLSVALAIVADRVGDIVKAAYDNFKKDF